MIRTIVVSPEAERDIIEIYVRGMRDFGASQANRYEAMLRRAIEFDLHDFPHAGVSREDLGDGIRSLYRGAPYIPYLVNGETLQIIRILPERMNTLPQHFETTPPKGGSSDSSNP